MSRILDWIHKNVGKFKRDFQLRGRLGQKKKKCKRIITLMQHGKVSAALRTVRSEQLIVLDIPPSVMNELKKKHPELQRATEVSII